MNVIRVLASLPFSTLVFLLHREIGKFTKWVLVWHLMKELFILFAYEHVHEKKD